MSAFTWAAVPTWQRMVNRWLEKIQKLEQEKSLKVQEGDSTQMKIQGALFEFKEFPAELFGGPARTSETTSPAKDRMVEKKTR